MKNHFLFPNSFKKIGWILFVPSFIFSLYILTIDDSFTIDTLNINVLAIYNDGLFKSDNAFFKIIENNIGDELYVIGLIVGGILIGFSKLKNEDEMISKIRYESLVWATYFNYAIIILFTIFFFGIGYYSILMFNTFTLLLFFIIRFHYKIYQLNKISNDDE
ncbi:hypothetical protein [Flavobacterium sp.]|uniref:hypothetical protein n=1 Tax=Flavobacterium sp. TaxID=239 RepID=UPI000EBA9CDC|nr:hypothetical protein [Flavobacterium sp.]HCQ11800.1 hypothetical protein [Flavobacterium sp.]